MKYLVMAINALELVTSNGGGGDILFGNESGDDVEDVNLSDRL